MDDWSLSYNLLTVGAATAYPIKSIEGLSPPDSREDVLDRAGDHGSYVFAEFLPERRVTIEGDIFGEPGSDFEGKVTDFRRAFVPRLDPLPLRYQFPSDILKRISCVPAKRTFPVDPDYSIGHASWAVQFIAGDPRIYADAEETITVGSSGAGSPGHGFDVAFDMGFGGGGGSGTSVAINDGVFNSPPSMRLAGPASNPRIRNVTSDKTLFFNITLASGEYLDIDVNKRTVFLNGDPLLSRYYTLDPSSVWWFIEPGSNTIQVQSGADNPALTVKWRDAWV